MRKTLIGLLVFFVLQAAAWAGPKLSTALLVDKKTNTLYVTKYEGGDLQVVKTLHVTLGKVVGDKEDEGDLKTPEGIYTFKTKLTPPKLKPKFGAMAYYLNFPNSYDQLAGRTGSDIMLHATNEPDRLKKDFDSEGCVVVNNEEIRDLSSQIRVGLTPILIFSELSPEYYHPGKDQKLVGFFNSWVQAWEGKEIEKYIDHYHSDFSAQAMNKSQWKKYKTNLNRQYAEIKVNPEDILYYRHPKYSMITFTQNYHSKAKSGKSAFHSRGTKILYIAEEAGEPKIIAETYTTLMW